MHMLGDMQNLPKFSKYAKHAVYVEYVVYAECTEYAKCARNYNICKNMQHQTYQSIHAKPNQPNKQKLFQTIYKTKPTNPNLPNQTYHTNQHGFVSADLSFCDNMCDVPGVAWLH